MFSQPHAKPGDSLPVKPMPALDNPDMFLKAGALSLALLLASRVLGLVRESAQAAAFGATGLGDVVVLMLSLPDWLTGVLASGALAYVLLPHWAGQTPAQQAAVQRRMAQVLLGLGVLLALLLLVLGGQLVVVLLPGLPAALRATATSALLWSAVSMPAALLAALWGTRLQHERDFVGLYAANLVVNAGLIAAMGWVAWRLGDQTSGAAAVLPLGLSLAGVMLLRLLWLHLRLRVRLHALDAPDPHTQGTLPKAQLWLWAVLSAGLPLALPFVARSLASASGEGALATFNYAWKLVELPLVLAIQLVASLAFPAITRAMAKDAAGREASDAVRSAYALAWTLACAAVAALLVGATAMAQLLFGWGRMDAAALARIAAWGATGAWSLLPQALIAVTLTLLATQGRMRPMVVAYATALGALLLAGTLGWRDGAALMGLLNVLLVGVAMAAVWALGPQWRQCLPWRAGVAPLAVLLLVAGLHQQFFAFAYASNHALALMLSVFFAIAVVALAFAFSADLRRALRR